MYGVLIGLVLGEEVGASFLAASSEESSLELAPSGHLVVLSQFPFDILGTSFYQD